MIFMMMKSVIINVIFEEESNCNLLFEYDLDDPINDPCWVLPLHLVPMNYKGILKLCKEPSDHISCPVSV